MRQPRGGVYLRGVNAAGIRIRENPAVFQADAPNSYESAYNETANFAAQSNGEIPRIR